MLYFDSCYVAKCYLNDPDAEAVRSLVRTPVPLYSSELSIAEVVSAIRRNHSERALTRAQATELYDAFFTHVRQGTWTLLPVSAAVLWDAANSLRGLPPALGLRAADAIHLATARSAGFTEIWTSDRQMLAASPRFGLRGRSA